jgi:hypothetical protein
MFGYPVEVSKHDDWPFNADYDKEEILQCLNAFFGHSDMYNNVFKFYEINRPGYGIDRSVTVLSNPKREYYTSRIYTKTNTKLKSLEVAFDPARYRKNRIQQLYITYFLNTKHLLILLQRFVFHPVCQFSRPIEITGLLEIIWCASKALILLDYNHNHWLASESGHLFYVDTDFMGQTFQDLHRVFYENFNQAMVFINPENCKLLLEVLPEFATRGNDYSQFLEEFFKVLKQYLESWKTVEVIPDIVQRKIDCLNNIFVNYWTE